MSMMSRWIAISALSFAIVGLVSGCSESAKPVKETTTTTTSVTEAPIPSPAPVTVVTPATTIDTTEEKRASHSTETGNNSTVESTNAYHSETTTITPVPMTVVPATPPPTEQTQTYEKRTYKEDTD